jgi:hypothetical protein
MYYSCSRSRHSEIFTNNSEIIGNIHVLICYSLTDIESGRDMRVRIQCFTDIILWLIRLLTLY